MSNLTLTQFLLDNPVDQNNIEEVGPLSQRLVDFKFKVRPMTGPEFNSYQTQCTTTGKRGKVDFNSAKFNELLILNHTVEPNFKDAELISKAGVQTPAQLIYKVLKAGEVIALADEISRASGFSDEEIKQLQTDAKN